MNSLVSRVSVVVSRVSGLPRRLSDPVVQSDLLLVTKAAAAAVIAWLVAVRAVELPQPFLAPWSALLTVHATVYRSVSRGAQQVGATVVGVLLSFVPPSPSTSGTRCSWGAGRPCWTRSAAGWRRPTA